MKALKFYLKRHSIFIIGSVLCLIEKFVCNELNLSPEKLERVHSNLEEKARVSVQEIQGQYYDTVD